MDGLWKRIIHSAPVVRLAARTIELYVRFVYATSPWVTLGAEYPAQLRSEGKSYIIAFWHGRLLLMPPARTFDAPLHVLISHHRDGELIARAMRPFGLEAIRGSTAKDGRRKGGTAALRTILQALKHGGIVAISPDGPRGPRMRASTGIAAAARLAKVPVIPLGYGVARRKVMSSWDRFIVPFPFNRGVYIWGDPIDVYSDSSETVEQAALRIETALNAVCAEADRYCGQTPIDPAPAVAGDQGENRG
jgi:lysophospholipid acyltransferase (LPLAT)-like uncharacterized protein